MANIFIDCGGYNGDTIRGFVKTKQYKSSDFEIYSFEPVVELTLEYPKMSNIHYYNWAVWDEDCELDFYIDCSRKRRTGSTIFENRRRKSKNFRRSIKVKCFDFSQWILDNFNREDYIFIDMDIEGSEYRVLNKMIRDGSIQYIDKLKVEFHLRSMHDLEEDHDSINSFLKPCMK